MDNFLLFFVFYTLMVLVFGSMQYVVYRTYTHWLEYSFRNPQSKRSLRLLAYIILMVGNLLFFPRFILSYTTWHDSVLLQQLLINPGGIYFAFIFVLFVCSVLFLFALNIRRLISFIRSFFMQYKARNRMPAPFKSESESNRLQETSNTAEFKSKDETPGKQVYSRRKFIRAAGTVAFGAPLLLTTVLSAATHRNYVVSRETLFFPELPSGLEGLKIAHISDIHSGIYMNKMQILEIFEIVNSLHPNLTVVTGDWVDTHKNEISNIRDTVSILKTDYGVFGCPGNHDHYASISGLIGALVDKPVTMLQNNHQTLTINGERLTLIGIDDAGEIGRNFDDLDFAIKHADPEGFKVLLSHRPHMFDEAINHGIDLTLSGHTHGGQIGFEFGNLELYPIDLFQKYSRGHYQKGANQLYVNVGVGLVGVPIRLVRPEITEITLTSRPELRSSTVINA